MTLQEIFEEIKCQTKKFLNETEDDIKKRLKRLLLTGVVVAVLVAVVASLFGSTVLFLLIGSILYLATFLPYWLAFIIIGVTALVAGVAILVAVYIIISKKLGSKEPKQLELV